MILKQPIYVFARGIMYLQITNDLVESFLDSYPDIKNNKIFQNGSINRKKRDDGNYHLTIIEPHEMKALTKNNISVDSIEEYVDLCMIGIGSVQTNASSCIYIVCISEHLNKFRDSLGLKYKDLHVTLGFTESDIHSVDKSLKTLIYYDPKIIIDHINEMMHLKTLLNYHNISIQWFLETNDQRFYETQNNISLILMNSLEFGHPIHRLATYFLVNKESMYLPVLFYESKYSSKQSHSGKLSHLEIHEKFSEKIRKHQLIVQDSDAQIVEKTLNVLNFPLTNNIKWLYELCCERSRTYYWYNYSLKNKSFHWYESPRNFSFVTENLSGSSVPDNENFIDFFHQIGIDQIVTLMETPLSDPVTDKIKSHKIKYSFFPVDDRTPPSLDQMRSIIKLIQNGNKTVIHCRGGVGRTATILIAYLITLGKTRAESTLMLQKRRTILSSGQEDFLKEWVSTCATWINPNLSDNSSENSTTINKKFAPKMKLPSLIMLVGLPASGKTTFSKTIEDQIIGIQRINQDEIRTKGKCEDLFSKHTKSTQTVILDRCNLSVSERKYWLDMSNNSSNEKNVWCIYFASNPEECKWRIKNRKNHPTVTDGIQGIRLIENISHTLQVPGMNEGFSHIHIIESFKDANILLLKIGCKIDHLVEINHDHIVKFPRTKHLYNLGAVTRDDLMVPPDDIEIFLKSQLYLEEKIDGANLGIQIKDFNLVAQNRSHYVNSSYHSQFKPLDKWLIDHSQDLWEILQDDTKILYGEWVYAKHSIHYTKLPDYFIAYDLWDMVEKRFYSRKRLETILANTSIKCVPLICSNTFDSMNQILKFVTGESQFYDGPIEGVYIRICDSMWLSHRAKIVRNDFLSGNEHWTKNIMIVNKILSF